MRAAHKRRIAGAWASPGAPRRIIGQEGEREILPALASSALTAKVEADVRV